MPTRRVLLVCLLTIAAWGRAEEPGAKDGWSESVNGLRARLLIGEVQIEFGDRIPKVFLELENIEGIPLEFTYAWSGLRCKLATVEGKAPPVPQSFDRALNGHINAPFRVELPVGGSLKFPISFGGYGIKPDYGTIYALHGGFWEIAANDPNDYLLSGTLTIGREEGDRLGRRWNGTIKIPAVKAPTKP